MLVALLPLCSAMAVCPALPPSLLLLALPRRLLLLLLLGRGPPAGSLRRLY